MKIFSANIIDLIKSIILLNYEINFSKFDNSLTIIISKQLLNNKINNLKIKQVVPIEYLNDINKMNALIDFMINKLEKNIIDNNINNENT